MTELTPRQRMARALRRQPVDRIPVAESFWETTKPAWVESGSLQADTSLNDYFQYESRGAGWPTLGADLDRQSTIVEETEETKLVRNGNGAYLRYWKNKAGTPEHVDFEVTDRAGWEEKIKPLLLDRSRLAERLSLNHYRYIHDYCRKNDLFFFWTGINVFEFMHPICGHEHMLMGMALDPDWITDMCTVFTDLMHDMFKVYFTEVGRPDAIWYYEDMGFKEKPFMSPAMYRELIFPAHKRTCDFAHENDLPVIMHSCGFVEPLLPDMIRAGIDALQAMEIKAGMDLLRIKKTYGDKIALCGGLDIRVLETNDLDQVEAMLQANIPAVMEGGGYILHSDHSIPPSVNFETYEYFLRRGREIGTYA